MRLGVLCAVLLMLPAASVRAAVPLPPPLYTTGSLQVLCNSTYDVDAGLCSGYIMGVADTLQQQNVVCLSPQISPETLTANIRRSWQQQPKQPENALQSVQDILQQRFPCR